MALGRNRKPEEKTLPGETDGLLDEADAILDEAGVKAETPDEAATKLTKEADELKRKEAAEKKAGNMGATSSRTFQRKDTLCKTDKLPEPYHGGVGKKE